MVVTRLPVREGVRRERRLDPVGAHGGRRALGRRLLPGAPHPERIPGVRQGTPGAPHPPQGGRRGDAPGSLPVKLEERCRQAVTVHQGRVSQLGVCPCEVYVHDDRVAGLTLLILKGTSVRLCLCVGHACADIFVLVPLDVTPVQPLLHVLAFVL